MQESDQGNIYYAHSANADGRWHPLSEHLSGTAKIAQSFARNAFEADLFSYAALLHDAGKYQGQFQEYLRNGGKRGSVPHAAIGAALRYKTSKQNAVALAILGHHQGLLDIGKAQSTLNTTLESNELQLCERRLFEENPSIDELEKRLDPQHEYQRAQDLASEFFVRYLFSILTDADWLDTEYHFCADRMACRQSEPLNTDKLFARLEAHFSKLDCSSAINQLRNSIREEVAAQSSMQPGFFSLNVPTGLGKTLTSIHWALKHAKSNGLKRIIIVLPFVNIIDQTAHVLSQILGQEYILEHHSGVLDDAQDNESECDDPRVLATENWDYPIIITTTVQFFESLFSDRPSKCRKLHNVADSIVIFDEVQTLRQELVLPTLEMLKQLHTVLNVSFLFCTATLPAFEARNNFAGIDHIHPLIKDPKLLFDKTKRVNYSIVNQFRPIPIGTLIEYVHAQDKSVLIVVNTKNDAKRIFKELKNSSRFERIYHLSTNMCPAHRKNTIKAIRASLADQERICVVSTQLIEAGVDFDFPVVFRALGPLESIIQAAGRCNREGIQDSGDVFLFCMEGAGMPPGLYNACAEHAKLLLSANIGFLDKHDSFSNYYRQVQSLFVEGDKWQINTQRKAYLFEQVAKSYQLIDKNTVPVFVRRFSENSEDLFEKIKGKPFLSRNDIRALQPYTINFFRQAIFKNADLVDKTILPGVCVWEGTYDPDLGVVSDGLSVEELVV